MASFDIANEWRQCILVLVACKTQWAKFVEQKKILSEAEMEQIDKAFVDCENFIDNRQETLESLVGYYEIYARLNTHLVTSATKMGMTVRMINAESLVFFAPNN